MLSISCNQHLLNARNNTILRSGEFISISREKELLAVGENLKMNFCGIFQARSRLGNYFFLDLGDDGIAKYLFWLGSFGYERSTAALFTFLAMKANYVFDIGSYSGYYSILASCLAGNRNVVSLEANPYNFHRLTENLSINNARVIAKNMAIIPKGDGPDEIKLMYNSQLRLLDTGGFVPHPKAEIIEQKKSKGDWFSVPTISFERLLLEADFNPDDLLNKDGKYILIKLDIEGLESSILADIVNALSRHDLQFIVVLEILNQPTFAAVWQIVASDDTLCLAYIDEYAQSLSVHIGNKIARTKGSRNFVVGSRSFINKLSKNGINVHLSAFEC